MVCHTLPGSRAAAAADNAERRADLEPLPEAEHMADNYEAAESETGTNDEERAQHRRAQERAPTGSTGFKLAQRLGMTPWPNGSRLQRGLGNVDFHGFPIAPQEVLP